MLKSALINQARECNYGEEEIANTGKILRNLWKEVGEEGFENWIRRAFILVQSEEILLSVLLEQSEEKTNERKNRSATSEKNHTEHALSKMWQEWENSSTPHRRKPNEQLSRELNKALLQLSCETAPAEVFMRCLRSACQGSQSMQQTLASMEKVKSEGLGYGIHKVDKGSSESAIPILNFQGSKGNSVSDVSDTMYSLNAMHGHDVHCVVDVNVPRHSPQGREQGEGIAGGAGICFTPSSFGGYQEGVGTLRANGGGLGGGSETIIYENHANDSRVQEAFSGDYHILEDL